MDSRQQFEEKYPLPQGMYYDDEQNAYAGTKDFWLWCARWESWQASRESLVVELPDDGIEDCQREWGDVCKNTFDCGYVFACRKHEQAILATGIRIK